MVYEEKHVLMISIFLFNYYDIKLYIILYIIIVLSKYTFNLINSCK